MTETISVVFSFRNEEATLPELIKRMRSTLDPPGIAYDLIFVNDASTDRSLEILLGYAAGDRRIKIITLSRRFGYNQGFMAGIQYASGDAVITMDADLQDPPETVPLMLEKWKQGAEIVHTVRTSRHNENFVKVLLTKAAYYLISRFSSIRLHEESGNFKLFTKRVAGIIKMLKEHDPYLRGLVAWTGFRQEKIFYERHKRFAGRGHFPVLRSTGPAKEFISGITSFSTVPLVLPILLGTALLIFSSSYGAYIFLKPHAGQVKSEHITWILLCGLAGMQILSLGFIGLYIGRLWSEASGRPGYIVESTVNMEKPA